MKQDIIPIELNGVNCYLIKTEKGFVLFDTAGHLTLDKEFSDRRDALIHRLEEAGCEPGLLHAIVLTHGDNDHVANAAYIRDKYQSVIAMHGDDVELVRDVTVEMMMKSFRYRSILLKVVYALMKKQIQKIMIKTWNNFTKFTPDLILKDGDDLQQFGLSAKVIHLPGHTPGSIGILFDNGELISGDIFTNSKKPAPAPNAMDFTIMRKSIKKLKNVKISTVYPGHGKPFPAEVIGMTGR